MSRFYTKKERQKIFELLSSEMFLKNLLYVVVFYMLVRMVSTFILAELYSQTWSVRQVNNIIPVIAFGTDPETYAEINTFSSIATAVFIAIAAWLGMNGIMLDPEDKKYTASKRARISAWTITSIMSIPQMFVAILVNSLSEIELNPIGFLIVTLAGAVTMIRSHQAKEHLLAKVRL